MNELYTDLMDVTKHEKQLCLDMINLSNENGSKDKECFPTVNQSVENPTCLGNHQQNIDSSEPSSSENTLASSISQVYAILNTSKDETFCDLRTFLEKKSVAFPSVDTNVSNEKSILTDADSNTSRSPLDSETRFTTLFSPEQPMHLYDTLQESDADSDIDFEPKKKARKLNSSCKDTKYAEMRRKNNFASRRSRQTKKQREKEMEEKAVMLEKENESLRIKEKKLQEVVDKLKEMLFSSVNKNR